MVWPFSRRRPNKRKLDAANGAEAHRSELSQIPASHGTDHIGPPADPEIPERKRSRKDTKRKSSRDSKKLQKDPRRTFSFTSRHDSIRLGRHENAPPVPPIPSNLKGKDLIARPQRSSTQPGGDSYEWERMPTLYKRTGQDLGRRRSDKRRRQDDHNREAEIKAMVAFLPVTPDAKSAGKLKKARSSKRSPEHPSSDVSLPLASSLRSSRSSNSGNETSFKLSTLDALAPRPTIRYNERPKYAPGASGFMSERSESRMRRISQRASVPEGAIKTSKRIDDLADDLSAGELRELMERDSKRRDKKRIAERIRAEQRIARQQEKQKFNEVAAVRNGTPPPPNMERGVMGREVSGLGIGTSTVVTSSKRKGSTGSDNGRGKRPSEIFRQETTSQSPVYGRNPFSSSRRSLATENMTPASDRSDPVLEIAQVAKVAKANVSPTTRAQGHKRGTSSISQMMDLSKQEASTPTPMSPIAPQEPARQPPRKLSQASTRAPQTWTSFFKLRQRNKNSQSPTPSSFSNTSRDLTHGAPVTQIGYQPMRSTSNIPKRTMSKFREDLPELPISPPASRVQSPEADEVPPIRSDYPEKRAVNILSEDPRVRYDTPNSYQSVEAARLRNETPTSGYRSVGPSPEPVAVMSQSMASIDSEASWLSGRKGSKRTIGHVAQHNQFHDSSSSLSRKYKDLSESSEELGIAEDEYFSRLSPGPEEEYRITQAGNPMPSSDEEDGGSLTSPVLSEKSQWKSAVARHPTIVHRANRAKSREVLLNDFYDDNPADENRNSFEIGDDISVGIQRATSVNLGQHHRNMSAGSARLLDLKPRGSGDAKRTSTGLVRN